MRYDSAVYVGKRGISLSTPAYFIADIASNHDGSLERAKNLIWMAKEAGADAVKFQHFKAERIVSDYGFQKLGNQKGHQVTWRKSVYEVYRQCELNRQWAEELAGTTVEAGVDFITSPYDFEAIENIDPYVPAYKIGSGDITWLEIIERIARRGKPVFLATGASQMKDVERAVDTVLSHNRRLVLLQCNTNYSGSVENFRHINLRVLLGFGIHYPNMILGLSDHTPGHSTVLGAIVLGARVIEKHFTDDNRREGPDHAFSMNPSAWREMILRSRELESALGNGIKQIEDNERETVIIQRRCLRLTRLMSAGDRIGQSDVIPLRPAPQGALEPYRVGDVVGKTMATLKEAGDALYASDIKEPLC